MPGQPPGPPGRVVLVKRFVMRDGATVGAQSAMLILAKMIF